MSETADSAGPFVNEGWEDILGNGKLTKKTVSPGTGSRPNMGNFVHVDYKVHAFNSIDTDVSTLESSEAHFHKSDSFYLGEGDAGLHALELGIALMNVGEKAVIKCLNPKLGYEGEPPEYRPENIPPTSFLYIHVELLSDDGVPPSWNERPRKERIDFANSKVDRGNAYCRAHIFASAINAYSAALRIVGSNDGESDDEEDDTAEDDIRVRALSGLSAAHFNSSSFENALKSCDDALRLKPDMLKVVFRRGRCLAQLGRLDEAKEAMMTARNMSTENPDIVNGEFNSFIKSELARVRSLLQADSHREAALFRRMIDVKPLPPSNNNFFTTMKKNMTYKHAAVVIILIVSLCTFICIITSFLLNDA